MRNQIICSCRQCVRHAPGNAIRPAYCVGRLDFFRSRLSQIPPKSWAWHNAQRRRSPTDNQAWVTEDDRLPHCRILVAVQKNVIFFFVLPEYQERILGRWPARAGIRSGSRLAYHRPRHAPLSTNAARGSRQGLAQRRATPKRMLMRSVRSAGLLGDGIAGQQSERQGDRDGAKATSWSTPRGRRNQDDGEQRHAPAHAGLPGIWRSARTRSATGHGREASSFVIADRPALRRCIAPRKRAAQVRHRFHAIRLMREYDASDQRRQSAAEHIARPAMWDTPMSNQTPFGLAPNQTAALPGFRPLWSGSTVPPAQLVDPSLGYFMRSTVRSITRVCAEGIRRVSGFDPFGVDYLLRIPVLGVFVRAFRSL